MADLRARGATVDSVVIDCEESMRSAVLLASPGQARAVESDKRWPRFAAAIGLPISLSSPAVLGSRDLGIRWDQAAFGWERGAVDRAVTNCVIGAYPTATVHHVVRFRSVGPAQVSGPAIESLMGIGGVSPSNPAPAGSLANGLEAIGYQASMTGLPQAPWLASPPATATAGAYWDELVMHSVMRGSGGVLVSATDRNAGERARTDIQAVMSEAGCGSTGWKVSDASTVDRSGTIMAVSSIEANGSCLWRITVSPDFDRSKAITLAFDDGTSASITVPAGAAGTWLRHAKSKRLSRSATGIPLIVPAIAGVGSRPLLINASPVSTDDRVSAGLSQYVIVYQDVQPGSRSTLSIDVPRVLDAARSELSKTPASWGVLNWEDPHLGIISAGPSHPKYQEAVSSICAALSALKREFPTVRWTIWGGFEMPFWKDGGNWSSFAQSIRDSLIANAVNSWSPVFDQCDWVMPWAYDVYDESMVAPWFKASLPIAAAQWSGAKVSAAREYQRRTARSIPVVVCLCPFFVGGGTARAWSTIPEAQLVQDQIDPAIRAGADGLAIWTACDWWVQVIDLPGAASMSASQIAVRDAVRGDIEAAVGPVDWSAEASASAARNRLAETIGKMARLCRDRLAASQFTSRILP
jgi:hypothetical protein